MVAGPHVQKPLHMHAIIGSIRPIVKLRLFEHGHFHSAVLGIARHGGTGRCCRAGSNCLLKGSCPEGSGKRCRPNYLPNQTHTRIGWKCCLLARCGTINSCPLEKFVHSYSYTRIVQLVQGWLMFSWHPCQDATDFRLYSSLSSIDT
jgi:hypothetical protein